MKLGDSLDAEWITLIKQARDSGLTAEETREAIEGLRKEDEEK